MSLDVVTLALANSYTDKHGGGGAGKDGTTFIPSVSTDGMLSWTNNGGLENPPAINIKGEKGDKGDTGPQGDPGADGYTPVKGTDYWTEEDKAEIVADTLAAFPTWTGGNY